MRLGSLSATSLGTLWQVFGGVLLLAVAATAAHAQEATSAATQPQAAPFFLGKVFTFLFLTIGPLKVIGPFAAMTRGRDAAFKRRLAFQGTVIALFAALAAATIGANTLHKWGVSAGALLLTAGIVLFLVALMPVLEQYAPQHERRPDPSDGGDGGDAGTAASPPSALTFSPLAFPTIITPYGIAVLVLEVTLAGSDTTTVLAILGIAAAVLVLDLLAMLSADRILSTPLVASALRIVGSVMGVLQVALGVQTVVRALHFLGIVGIAGAGNG